MQKHFCTAPQMIPRSEMIPKFEPQMIPKQMIPDVDHKWSHRQMSLVSWIFLIVSILI